jgi:hypothetical protein
MWENPEDSFEKPPHKHFDHHAKEMHQKEHKDHKNRMRFEVLTNMVVRIQVLRL